MSVPGAEPATGGFSTTLVKCDIQVHSFRHLDITGIVSHNRISVENWPLLPLQLEMTGPFLCWGLIDSAFKRDRIPISRSLCWPVSDLLTKMTALFEVKAAFSAFIQHWGYVSLLYHRPWELPFFTTRGAAYQQTQRTLLAKEGTIEFGQQFRNFRRELGSFSCHKAGTWDGLFYFPSEGRHAVDFSNRKNPMASVGIWSKLSST
jgi:hypothetical protein